jgi:hypothetical protein
VADLTKEALAELLELYPQTTPVMFDVGRDVDVQTIRKMWPLLLPILQAATLAVGIETYQPSGAELLQQGGEWLGAARNWLKWHKRNGEHVTWGSDDVLEGPFTVREVEDLAAEVAAAAMAPQPAKAFADRNLRARWEAERNLAAALDFIRDNEWGGHEFVEGERVGKCLDCGALYGQEHSPVTCRWLAIMKSAGRR